MHEQPLVASALGSPHERRLHVDPHGYLFKLRHSGEVIKECMRCDDRLDGDRRSGSSRPGLRSMPRWRAGIRGCPRAIYM